MLATLIWRMKFEWGGGITPNPTKSKPSPTIQLITQFFSTPGGFSLGSFWRFVIFLWTSKLCTASRKKNIDFDVHRTKTKERRWWFGRCAISVSLGWTVFDDRSLVRPLLQVIWMPTTIKLQLHGYLCYFPWWLSWVFLFGIHTGVRIIHFIIHFNCCYLSDCSRRPFQWEVLWRGAGQC